MRISVLLLAIATLFALAWTPLRASPSEAYWPAQRFWDFSTDDNIIRSVIWFADTRGSSGWSGPVDHEMHVSVANRCRAKILSKFYSAPSDLTAKNISNSLVHVDRVRMYPDRASWAADDPLWLSFWSAANGGSCVATKITTLPPSQPALRSQSPAPQVPAGVQAVYGHFPDYPDFPYYPNNKQDIWFTVPTAQGCLAQQHFLPPDANNSREQRIVQAMKYKTLEWQGTGCVPGEPINGTGTLTLRYAFQTSSYWASWSGTMVNGAMNGPVRLANSRRPDQYTMTYYGGCAKVAPESGMSACTPLPKQHGSASSSPQTAQNNAVRNDGPKGPVPNVAVNTVMNGPAGLPTCIRIEKVGTRWNSPKAEIDPQVVTTVRMTNACGKNVLILVRYSSDGENNWTDAVWKGGMLFANGALRSWPVGPARPVIPFPSTDRDMAEPFEPGTVVAEIIHGAAKVYGPINFKLAYCPLAVKVDGEWRTNVLFHEVPAVGVGRIVCVPLPKGY
jgi:hypothetical protein